jgi:hypothetical protein
MMAIMGSCSQNRNKVFDKIRKKWVAETPEERVRQIWIQKMIQQLGFPKELLAVEKELKELPHLKLHAPSLPERRADILCFAKGIHPEYSLYPLLVMECKEDKNDLSDAIEQVIGYNHFVNAYFLAAASEEECRFGYFDKDAKAYRFLPFLPSYLQLITLVKNAG